MAKMEMNEKDEQAREKYLKRIEKLRLMDDDFFSECAPSFHSSGY